MSSPIMAGAWGLARVGADMTANRRSKRAIRSRMTQTGEKYTQARRALLPQGGGAGDDPGATFTWPPDPLGWFTDQAYNAILLADDEARMLGDRMVEPEHLLLAAARYGNVESLLAGAGIEAAAIHEVIVRVKGFGSKLELRPRRSPASEEVLRRAVTAGTGRGVPTPSTQHLLIALGECELPARVLAELGVDSAQALVDAHYPVEPPVDHAYLERRAAQLASNGSQPPSPGPIPPLFERFTSQARAAVDAAAEYARRADDRWVEPVHLLAAVLDAEAGVAATVRARYGWPRPPAAPAGPPASSYLATGIFTPEARRIVAEDVLIIAERLDHRTLTTGHVLLAVLERYAYLTIDFIDALPSMHEVTAAVTAALPGQEDT